MADNETIVRQQIDNWNQRKFEATLEVVAPDGKIVFPGTGETFEGRDGAMAYNKMWADAFPDGKVTVDNIVSAGDTVVVEYTGRGTHTGTLKTSMGDIPPTGKSLVLKLCDVTTLRDGMVVEQRSYFDSGSMMAQLGLTGQPAATQQ